MKIWIKPSVAILIVAILSGCGGGVSQRRSTSRQEPTIRGTSFPERLQPASQARAEECEYHGWPALRLTKRVSNSSGGPGYRRADNGV